ncbi:DUF3829 domain-containing protein [Thorsellia anophelis]|uniref:DUF3829 domain-containing protein n=1 Tax=Thorsellia anophelis DSM 18579 TaxID=1123402 RepID=A0A1I0ABA0_9GAMM|nr:DUF3829 domain-containing protein [Thorsellia anophelis]SES91489.1 Protein of unknown function [Thorsellia anophelis DSM 18579]
MNFLKVSLISVILCNALLVVGCDNAKTNNTNEDKNSSQAETSTTEAKATGYPVTKYNAYIEYLDFYRRNSLQNVSIGGLTIAEQLRNGDFTAMYNGTANQYKSKASYLQDRILNKFEGSIEELDSAAQSIVSTINAAQADFLELETYVSSRKYEDDNGALGKTLMEKVLPHLKAIDAAELAFEIALDKEGMRLEEQDLAELKASGNILGYNTLASISLGGKLTDMIAEDPETALATAGNLEIMNNQIIEIEGYLSEIKKVADAETPDSFRQKKIKDFYDDTQKFIGAYRNTRSNPTGYNAGEEVLDAYNHMIYSYNDLIKYNL